MSVENVINEDIKKAMLAKDKMRLTALRSVKSAFLLAKTESAHAELSDDKAIQIMQKLLKQRNESAETYKQQNRDDLYQVEIEEAKVIAEYLPKPLTESELRTILSEIVQKSGLTGMQNMGKIMGLATQELGGKADGKLVATIVKELLNK